MPEPKPGNWETFRYHFWQLAMIIASLSLPMFIGYLLFKNHGLFYQVKYAFYIPLIFAGFAIYAFLAWHLIQYVLIPYKPKASTEKPEYKKKSRVKAKV